MPRDTRDSRSASTKRRSKASDQLDNQPSESTDSLVSGRGNPNGVQHPAIVLASSQDALKRLAGIAQYLESTLLSDIKTIEGNCGIEIDKEKEIEKLNNAVETLMYKKKKEVESLEQENRELKDGEEACRQERERCLNMQAELKASSAEAEARVKEEYETKLQEEKSKAQKQIKTKKAELEIENRQKMQDAENQSKELSARNDALMENLSAAEEKLKAKKTKHARELKSIELELAEKTSDLEQVKREFPVEGQSVEYYAQSFQDISHSLETISLHYFQKLSEQAIKKADVLHQTMRKHDPILDYMSFLETASANFLRVQIARHITSSYLCDHIWQPYLTERSHPSHQALNQLLDNVSASLLAAGGRCESAWRALTLRGIDALAGTLGEVPRAASPLQRVLDGLGLLISAEDIAKFEEDMKAIVNKSAAVWEHARKDQHKLIVARHPDAEDTRGWHAIDIDPLEGASTAAPLPTNQTLTPLCLFPHITQVKPRGQVVVIHQGSALFPNSHVWTQAILENKEHEEELDRAIREAKSKVNARRTSVPVSPTSPPKGVKLDLAPTKFKKVDFS